MRYQIPLMIESGGGSIVNCSAVAGIVGAPFVPAYVASKHGVTGLTKAAAIEYQLIVSTDLIYVYQGQTEAPSARLENLPPYLAFTDMPR